MALSRYIRERVKLTRIAPFSAAIRLKANEWWRQGGEGNETHIARIKDNSNNNNKKKINWVKVTTTTIQTATNENKLGFKRLIRCAGVCACCCMYALSAVYFCVINAKLFAPVLYSLQLLLGEQPLHTLSYVFFCLFFRGEELLRVIDTLNTNLNACWQCSIRSASF